MRSRPLFSAPSLAEVLKQLRIYRPSGLLTIQRVTGAQAEEAYITVERGQPTLIIWNRQQQAASEKLLAWLNSWGEIRFDFQSAEPLLQLPPPASSPGEASALSEPPQRQAWSLPGQHSGPLPAVRRSASPRQTIPLKGAQAATGRAEQNGRPTPHLGEGTPLTPLGSTAGLPPITVVPTLTPRGKEYAATGLPRYDRIVFLLINGRRTLGDLAQLTRRTPGEIYTTLERLQQQGLISLEQPPLNGHHAPGRGR
jgi:hypothetical protein